MYISQVKSYLDQSSDDSFAQKNIRVHGLILSQKRDVTEQHMTLECVMTQKNYHI